MLGRAGRSAHFIKKYVLALLLLIPFWEVVYFWREKRDFINL
jgi:hypothetical protein